MNPFYMWMLREERSDLDWWDWCGKCPPTEGELRHKYEHKYCYKCDDIGYLLVRNGMHTTKIYCDCFRGISMRITSCEMCNGSGRIAGDVLIPFPSLTRQRTIDTPCDCVSLALGGREKIAPQERCYL